MAWVQMAVTLAGLSSALLSLQYTIGKGTTPEEVVVDTVISTRTVDIVTMAMVPLSILIVVYAMYIFWQRSEHMRNAQFGVFDEKLFPLLVGGFITACLAGVFVLSLVDIFLLGR
eukprot:evm.model.scf_430.8 EVM.evm.TU.scf_430.8   scf_430:59176-60054(+)